MFPCTYVPRYRCSLNLCSHVPMFPGTDVPRTYVPRTYVPRYRCSSNLCSHVPMFPGTDVPRTYVPLYLCSPVPMFPEPMFPGAYVPLYLCSPVPMFPGTYVPRYRRSAVFVPIGHYHKPFANYLPCTIADSGYV